MGWINAGVDKGRHPLLVFILLLTMSIGCSLIGGEVTDGPETEATEVSPTTEIEAPATEQTPESGIPVSACEAIPEAAAVRFLYDLPLQEVVSEDRPNGVYCRFGTIDLEEAAADLGASRANATLQLWDSIEACVAADPEAGNVLEEPPAPWQYMKVVPIPNKPELILLITAHNGQNCLTLSSPDISSQPLEHWLEFMDAIVESLG